MRLESFVITEGRSVPMPMKEAVAMVESQCRNALKDFIKGKILYRGIDSKNPSTDALYIEPKKHNRESANTSNEYTLVIDNHPKWKAYPKRSQSIICSNERDISETFGYLFYVFPKDGAKYGICPTDDLWTSFEKGLNHKYMNLQDFTGMLEYHLAGKLLNIPNYTKFKTYSDLVGKFKEIDAAIEEDGIDNRILGDIWTPLKRYKGDLLKIVQEALDPNKNGFKLASSISGAGPGKEIWTDSPSVMIYEEAITENWAVSTKGYKQ